MILLEIDFKKLRTDRLQRYFNSEKARYHRFINNFYCELCQEHHLDDMTDSEKEISFKWDVYIKDIKFELNKRKNSLDNKEE